MRSILLALITMLLYQVSMKTRSTFYRYTGINEYSLKSLRENSIWLSSPQKFNDPFDCQTTIMPMRQKDLREKVAHRPIISFLSFNENSDGSGGERPLREPGQTISAQH